MRLSELINSVKVVQVTGDVIGKEITGITADSRKVEQGSLFVAIPGYKFDGHKFIQDAVNNGALAVVLENDSAMPAQWFDRRDVVKIIVRDSRAAMAELAVSFYDNPAEGLDLVGVTGTKGKTTTTYYIKKIFETAGKKAGLIGTIANYVGERELPAAFTTPEAIEINDLLSTMVNEGCGASVMEVSSHALYLKRVQKLKFSAAVFTNITHDHLDFHKTFEEYLAAKKLLFDMLPASSFAVVNSDDQSWKAVVKDSPAKLLRYGKSEEADVRISDIQFDLDGTSFTLHWRGIEYAAETGLIGPFNAYNAAAAFSAAVSIGIPAEDAIEGIKATGQVPGRFEVVSTGEKKVIVDYSHTADSLEQALQSIRKLTGKDQQVWTIVGCGGDRDRQKRPVMGRIASDYSDKVFVTNDNPRTEDPQAIANEILSGITQKNYEVILDREEAIKQAVQLSPADAVVLIAGKGHEEYQVTGNETRHFSDKETAQKYL